MVEYGTGPAGHPYHRFGTGDEQLVIFPGLTDSLGWNEPDRLTAELLARHYFRAFREYDVWVISRPPGLSEQDGAREMAAGYADVLDTLGAAHVLGISLGGLVASHLAAMRPALVERLVLGVCGTTLGTEGRETVRRWKAYSEREEWGALHVDYAKTVYTGIHRRVMGLLYRGGARWLPRPQVPADVQISCAAALDYDGAEILPDIDVPTLVVGGSQDRLFPVATQKDCARRLPDGHVATLDGGHAVYDEKRGQFCDTVCRFLSGEY